MAKQFFYKINIEGDDVILKRSEEIKKRLSDINKELNEVKDNDAYVELKEEQLKLMAAMKDVTKEQNLLIKQFQGARAGAGSYRDVEARLEAAREALRRMSKEERDSDIGKETKEEIAKLTREVKDLDKELKLTFRNIGDYSGGIKDALGGILPGFKNISDELENIRGSGGGGGGLAGALKIGAGAFAIGSVLVDATKDIKEFVDELGELRREANAITRETGEGLDEVVVRSRALSEQFGGDANEIIRAVNVIKNEFGVSFGEAFDLIEDGFARGLDKGGEFLDNIREYSGQFADNKFQAKELFNVLELQLTKGIYSDKGVDAIKEAGLSLRELTKPALDALDAIGLSGEEIQKVIGEKGVGEAIRVVSKRLQDFKDDSGEVGQVLADIFKGAGEDAGVGFVKSLGDMGEGLSMLDGETLKYVEMQKELLESNKELAAAQNEVTKRFEGSGVVLETFGNKIKTGAINVLVDFLDLFKPLVESFMRLFAVVEEGGEKGALGKFVEFVGNVARKPLELLVGMLTRAIDTFTFLSGVISDFVNNSPLISGFFNAVFERIERWNKLWMESPAIFEGVKSGFEQVVENIKRGAEDMYLGLKLRFEQLKTLNPFGDVADKASEEIERIKNRRKEIEGTGRGVGEAFADGYRDGLEKIRKTQKDIVGGSIGEGGGSVGGGGGGLSQAQKDARKKLEKEREVAREKLEKEREKELEDEKKFELERVELLRELAGRVVEEQIKVMEDGLEKEKEVIRANFEERIKELEKLRSDFLRKSAEVGRSEKEVSDVLDKIKELEVGAREVLNKELVDLDKEFREKGSKERLDEVKKELDEMGVVTEGFIDELRIGFSRGNITEGLFNERVFEEKKKGLIEKIEKINEEVELEELVLEVDGEKSNENIKELLRIREGLNVELAELDKEREKQVEESARNQLEGFQKAFAEVAGFVQRGLDIFQGFTEAQSERRQQSFDDEIENRRAQIDSLKEKAEEAEGEEKERLEKSIKAEEQAILRVNKLKENEAKRLAKKEKFAAVISSIINTAVAVTQALPNLILAAIVGGLGLAQTGIILAQPAAEGGIVGDMMRGLVDVVSGRRVNGRSNMKRTSQGDDVLIAAKRGEVVLTEEQVKRLGGAEVMRAVGVKGFAEGGIIGAPSVSGSGDKGVFMEVLDVIDRKTDAINLRIDRLRTYIVSDDLGKDERERKFIKTQTTL